MPLRTPFVGWRWSIPWTCSHGLAAIQRRAAQPDLMAAVGCDMQLTSIDPANVKVWQLYAASHTQQLQFGVPAFKDVDW